MLSVKPSLSQARKPRRGAITVFVALMLIVIFAATALCIDIGWTTLTKSQLQTAADAAAAAGAGQLGENYAAYSTPRQPNKAGLIAQAIQDTDRYTGMYGSYNSAGGVKSLSILAGDMQVGFTDAHGNYQASGYAGYPNTITVVARRDASANAPLPLFFAPLLGKKTQDLSATASATIYTGLISGFDPNGGGVSTGGEFNGGGGGGWGGGYWSSGDGFDCGLLPVAFDVNTWTQFFSTGLSSDGTVHTDSTGAAQIQIYPNPHNSPGNFGLLCIGAWTNATPDYSNWILNGPSAGDLQALCDAGSFPVSLQSPKPWKGSPGLRSTLGGDFASIIGQPRLLPLFQPASVSPYQAASGNGSNTTYAIVGFVGVTVTEATGSGNNLTICVKPCDVTDPTAVFDPSTVYPVGAEPSSQFPSFTHPVPKFTR
ncbi:MAG: hypothetical protein HY290_30025 [Planctomycetia bacterium]|nr:hypothetical protein [Planctomycetia bacterium]